MAREEGIDLLATYAGQAPLLKEWSRGAQINTDRNLRLQYLAGMWLNSDMGERILSSILAHYRFPDQTFVGSPEGVHALKQALDQEGRRASAGLARGRRTRNATVSHDRTSIPETRALQPAFWVLIPLGC